MWFRNELSSLAEVSLYIISYHNAECMLDQMLRWGFRASYESACTSYTNSQTHHVPYTASLLLTSYTKSKSEIWEVRWRYCTINLVGGKVGKWILKKTAALSNYAKFYTYIMESVGRKLRQPVSVQAWMRPPHTSSLLFTNTLYLQTQTLLAKGSDLVTYIQNTTFQNLPWTSDL